MQQSKDYRGFRLRFIPRAHHQFPPQVPGAISPLTAKTKDAWRAVDPFDEMEVIHTLEDGAFFSRATALIDGVLATESQEA